MEVRGIPPELSPREFPNLSVRVQSPFPLRGQMEYLNTIGKEVLKSLSHYCHMAVPWHLQYPFPWIGKSIFAISKPQYVGKWGNVWGYCVVDAHFCGVLDIGPQADYTITVGCQWSWRLLILSWVDVNQIFYFFSVISIDMSRNACSGLELRMWKIAIH